VDWQSLGGDRRGKIDEVGFKEKENSDFLCAIYGPRSLPVTA
jgi:hypothetical protein